MEAWNTLVRLEDSDWLREMLRRRREYLGEQWAESEDPFQHYRIYFDNFGCIDVISRSAIVSGPFERLPEA
jgi:hypothetical protein